MPNLDANDLLVKRLRALAHASPNLADVVRVYEIILPLLRDADLRPQPIAITRADALAKLADGQPLLCDVALAFDEARASVLLKQLACALEASAPKYHLPWSRENQATLARASAAGKIRLALECGKLNSAALLTHALAGDKTFALQLAEQLELDADLMWTLAQDTLKPAMRAWNRQLATLVSDGVWGKSGCWLCGTPAALGELQGNTQVKHLRCNQCGGDWALHHSQCIFCGNSAYATRQYLYPPDDRAKWRIEACDECGGYLKVINAFEPTPPEFLIVEDLATLELDFIAQARGYARVQMQDQA